MAASSLIRSCLVRAMRVRLHRQIRSSSSATSLVFLREEMKRLARANEQDKVRLSRLKGLIKYDVKSQDELPKRQASESCKEAILPLSGDQQLQEKYSTVNKSIRFGMIMEDLDLVAVWAAYTYAQGPLDLSGQEEWTMPFHLWTVVLDRIDVTDHPMNVHDDVFFAAKVTWVGLSSLEMTVSVSQSSELVMVAKFVLVTRQMGADKPAFINAVELATDEEKRLFRLGEESRLKRKKQCEESLFKMIPTVDEVTNIHHMFLETANPESIQFGPSVAPNNCRWMEDTIVKSAIMCFPEQRNIYQMVFGGFLMRQSIELAEINAMEFSGQQPRILTVDDIHFRHPVPIGSYLIFSSQVGYTQDTRMLINVRCDVVNPKKGTRKTTNIFHYLFGVENKVPTVLPRTYAEAMLYIDSRRHFLH